jgi:hypothetical protein
MSPPPFKSVILGPLPHRVVSLALGFELSPGKVCFSEQAQNHVWNRHQEHFELCYRVLPQLIRRPTCIGQGPNHRHDAFEMILSLADDIHILAGIRLRPTRKGLYHVKSSYPISSVTIAHRLQSGHLRKVSLPQFHGMPTPTDEA